MNVAVAGVGLRQAAPTLVPGIHAPARTYRRIFCCAYKRPELNGIGEQRNQPRYRPHFASGLRLRARLRLCKYLVQRLLLKLGLVSLVQRRWKAILAAGVLGCTVALGCVVSRLSAVPAATLVPYSSLIEALEAQTVQRLLFEEGSPQIFFSLREKQVEQAESSVGVRQELKPSWQYCARKIRHDETYLLGLLRAGKVEYMSAPRSVGATLGSVAATVVTLWIPLAPLLWLMHRQLNGNSNFTRKRRKTVQLVRFGDVAGVDSAKAELLEIVSCLKGHSSYLTLGAKFPKGVLLIGPPGTGKTLLARALAGEAGVPFFATSASEFVEMFVGRGAARIRELFAAARKAAPSVIFIDELDAVGGQRGRGFTDERDQTLNQLLTEMDGFGAETGVLVLAATNRPEVLDPALCRPGRFSRKVYVREPDLEGRRQVLAVHTRNIRIGQDADSIQRTVAAMTPGFVGADLANVVNEAALLAARKGQTTVTLDNFKEAVHRAKYGVGQEPGLLSGLEKKVCSLLATVVPGAKEAGGGEASYQAVI